MSKEKTNAMRMLDKAGIVYQIHTYDSSDGQIDGASVARKMKEDPERVYKTLVTVGHSRRYYVFVIPVLKELDLKTAAKTVGEKSVEMIKTSDLLKVTGYIRGGCSPVGMKKQFYTVIDSAATVLETFYVSGGKIGLQIEVSPMALKELVQGEFASVTHLLQQEGEQGKRL